MIWWWLCINWWCLKGWWWYQRIQWQCRLQRLVTGIICACQRKSLEFFLAPHPMMILVILWFHGERWLKLCCQQWWGWRQQWWWNDDDNDDNDIDEEDVDDDDESDDGEAGAFELRARLTQSSLHHCPPMMLNFSSMMMTMMMIMTIIMTKHITVRQHASTLWRWWSWSRQWCWWWS